MFYLFSQQACALAISQSDEHKWGSNWQSCTAPSHADLFQVLARLLWAIPAWKCEETLIYITVYSIV